MQTIMKKDEIPVILVSLCFDLLFYLILYLFYWGNILLTPQISKLPEDTVPHDEIEHEVVSIPTDPSRPSPIMRLWVPRGEIFVLHSLGLGRVVTEDGVYFQVHAQSHRVLIVDCPYIDLFPELMCFLDESLLRRRIQCM